MDWFLYDRELRHEELNSGCLSEKCPGTYSEELWQTLKMELFVKIVNNFQLFTIFAKGSILDT